MLYREIPITNQGEIRYFNFDTIGGEPVQGCRIWSGQQELMVDENLEFVDGDLPVDWVNPAIDKLRHILGLA